MVFAKLVESTFIKLYLNRHESEESISMYFETFQMYFDSMYSFNVFWKIEKQEILNFQLQTCVSTEREVFYSEFTKKLFFLKQAKVLNIHIYKPSVYDTESFDRDVLAFLRQA